MSTIRCPKCGEEYSDSYKSCPFCQEDEAIRRGKPLRRRGGKRLDKRKRSAGAGGVMLLVTAVIIIGVVGFVFFGDQVAGLMGIRTEQDEVDVPDTLQADTDDGGDAIPEEDASGEETDPQTPDVPQEPAGPLALDRDAMTIPAGETALLTATGGTGEVTWTSSNENIATVANGSVTGVAGGTVTITAAAGEETVSCSVTVTGDPWVSSANLSLNRTDFTLNSHDEPWQMVVNGTDSPVTWASNDPSIAAISADGVVSWVSPGTTTVTATVDGQVLECIVRVVN